MNQDEFNGRKAARKGGGSSPGLIRTVTTPTKATKDFERGHQSEQSKMRREELNKLKKK